MSDSSRLTGDAELLGQARDGIAIEGGVDIHGALDDKNDTDDRPFLPSDACMISDGGYLSRSGRQRDSRRIGKAGLFRTILILELHLVLKDRA